ERVFVEDILRRPRALETEADRALRADHRWCRHRGGAGRARGQQEFATRSRFRLFGMPVRHEPCPPWLCLSFPPAPCGAVFHYLTAGLSRYSGAAKIYQVGGRPQAPSRVLRLWAAIWRDYTKRRSGPRWDAPNCVAATCDRRSDVG